MRNKNPAWLLRASPQDTFIGNKREIKQKDFQAVHFPPPLAPSNFSNSPDFEVSEF